MICFDLKGNDPWYIRHYHDGDGVQISQVIGDIFQKQKYHQPNKALSNKGLLFMIIITRELVSFSKHNIGIDYSTRDLANNNLEKRFDKLNLNGCTLY